MWPPTVIDATEKPQYLRVFVFRFLRGLFPLKQPSTNEVTSTFYTKVRSEHTVENAGLSISGVMENGLVLIVLQRKLSRGAAAERGILSPRFLCRIGVMVASLPSKQMVRVRVPYAAPVLVSWYRGELKTKPSSVNQ